MAYDEALAERIRSIIGVRPVVSERKMFGGLAFLVAGNMAVGIVGEDLMVRLHPADAERALAEPHVREMDFTGRPMRGFVFVDADAIADDGALARWVDAGADHAASLPPKGPKSPKATPKTRKATA